MDKTGYVIILAVIFFVIGGPMLALAMKSKKNLKDYADRKAKFEAGQGKDPNRSIVGPHKPFVVNAVIMGLIFCVVGGIVAYIVA